jgi:hypothetical protein
MGCLLYLAFKSQARSKVKQSKGQSHLIAEVKSHLAFYFSFEFTSHISIISSHIKQISKRHITTNVVPMTTGAFSKYCKPSQKLWRQD